MVYFLIFISFIFGTAVGSFLNVIAYRSVHDDPAGPVKGPGLKAFQRPSPKERSDLERDDSERPDLKKSPRSGLKSIFLGSSVCPKCKHKLGPVDLVPVISFLLLKGRCRYCQKKISFQYPIVEFATGILFAFAFYHWYRVLGLSAAGVTAGQEEAGVLYQGAISSHPITIISLLGLLYLLFIVGALIVLFITDIKDGLLPNSIVLPAIAAVVVFRIILLVFSNLVSVHSLSVDLVASILVAFAFFAIVYLSKERALGGGDIKFVFLIALAVGWPSLLVALWLAFLTGGAVAAMLLLLGKKRFGQTVPLGPFLAFGGTIALLYGSEIIRWYFSFLGA